MEHVYAQALWKMVQDGTTPSKAVHAIRDLLASHGREALLPHVGRAFARLAERDNKKNDVVLTVARDTDERHAYQESKSFLEDLDSKDLPAGRHGLKTQVDDTIIGGWRLEGRGMLVDASYKNRLLELYNRVTST